MKNKLARVRLGLDAKPLVPLLGDGELHSLALGQRDERLVALEKKEIVEMKISPKESVSYLADDEHIVQPSGEHMALGVLDVHDIE